MCARHPAAVRVPADKRLYLRRIRLVHHCSCLGSCQLALFQVAVAHHLEQDREDDEAEVRVADQMPREAVQEANFVANYGRWARLLAEGAGAILDLRVAVKNAICINWVLTWHRFRVQLNWRDALLRSEVNVGFAIHGAIVAQEVQEGDRAADTGRGNEGGTLARCVDSAGVVCIDAHLNVGVVVVDVDTWRVAHVQVPARFTWVAGVLAPHALEVRCAHGAIGSEDTIKLLVVVLHDRGSV